MKVRCSSCPRFFDQFVATQKDCPRGDYAGLDT